jgi:hypothetical protein
MALRIKALHIESRAVPVAMSDRDIDIVAREINIVRRRRNAQIHFRMLLGKAAQAVNQPFRGKVGRSADGQNAALLTLQQPFGADSDLVQRITDDRQVIAASFGEDQPLPFVDEELERKCIFERFHVMADGALRDVQLLGGAREAFAPGGSLESL